MKILLVHPGASISVHDVYTGLRGGLVAEGHQIYDYNLDQRIAIAHEWFKFTWRRATRRDQTLTKPTHVDELYKAGEELVGRALRVMPDWIVVVSSMFLHPDILVLMDRARLNVAVLFTESPYDDDRQERLLPFCKQAWTNERLSSARMKVPFLPHAWTEGVHDTPDDAAHEDVPAHDVVFVGTAFDERIELLSAVDWTGIDLGLYGQWQNLGSRHRLRKYVRNSDSIPNTRAAALYRKAKVGLNLYRESMGFGRGAPRVTAAQSLNPRAYELAAAGCFTISSYRDEVPMLFGASVPTFRSADELGGLIRHWLARDAEREAVRATLPGLVATHTWRARARQVIDDLQRAGTPDGAAHVVEPMRAIHLPEDVPTA